MKQITFEEALTHDGPILSINSDGSPIRLWNNILAIGFDHILGHSLTVDTFLVRFTDMTNKPKISNYYQFHSNHFEVTLEENAQIILSVMITGTFPDHISIPKTSISKP